MSLTSGYHYQEAVTGDQADEVPEKGSDSLLNVSCGQAPSLWLKQQTQLTPAHGLPQLQPALLSYLQINLPLRGIQAGLAGKVLQLDFPQWVSPGGRGGVASRGGPWVGLVVGDLVGAICSTSLGVVQAWSGVVIEGP